MSTADEICTLPFPRRTHDEAATGRAAGGTVRHDLTAMLGEGVTASVMVGIGETYLPAFILFLGAGEVASGLMTSLPMLVGATLQLASPWGVARFGSYRKWVVACAMVQALSLLALVAVDAALRLSAGMVFCAASLYWAAGLAAAPAWNTWVDQIVPRAIRARFFARRARFCQAGVLAGFLSGGLVLHFATAAGPTVQAFTALFAVAAGCRFVSAWLLSRQSEHTDGRPGIHGMNVGQTLWRSVASLGATSSAGADAAGMESDHTNTAARATTISLGKGPVTRDDGSARLLTYLFAVQVAVQISGPYFTPYMLRELSLSLTQYTLLVALAYVAKVIASPLYGRLAQRIGARGLLWLGGLGIAPVAGLWVVSDQPQYLACVQLVSGTAWAAYDLAVILMFLDAVPRRRRTGVLTLYNFGNAVAMLIGALLGGAVLQALGENREAYCALFGLSSVGRLAALALLTRVGKTSTAGRAVDRAARRVAIPDSADVDSNGGYDRMAA